MEIYQVQKWLDNPPLKMDNQRFVMDKFPHVEINLIYLLDFERLKNLKSYLLLT